MDYFAKIIRNILEKMANEDAWISIGEGCLKILGILLISMIVVRLGKLAIQNIFAARRHSPLRISERREATLLKLLQNVLTYVIYFIAILMILSTLTIDVGALLAGAGIVGLAVGFGAQSLVKDIITGFFIIFEDQFSVGDHVRIGQFEGTVEEIGLRTTKIKQWTGELHILPNGSIIEVTNFSMHNSVAVVDISISYEEDIKRVEEVIRALLSTMMDKYEDIVSEPQLLGVQSLGASEVLLRVTAETTPMRHFPIARELRKEIKLCLDKQGIEIPYPRLVMYSRQEHEPALKQGV
ncbi:mechanosensitive ion channel family protein [Bacillus tuaregi]|uniref:mechanosensitive ion channel family protein n=1 Tax=Bacillus tuaregi TaxID=1816695 RepID=UPI0008F86C50|nr:mechanosensitive ion channel family protein [Bacillus tuaregi]